MFLKVHSLDGKEMLVNIARVVFVHERGHETRLLVDVGDPEGTPKIVAVKEYMDDIYEQALRMANGDAGP